MFGHRLASVALIALACSLGVVALGFGSCRGSGAGVRAVVGFTAAVLPAVRAADASGKPMQLTEPGAGVLGQVPAGAARATTASRGRRFGVPDDSLQAIVVTATDWHQPKAQLRRFERQDYTQRWTLIEEPVVTVSLGRNGMAWGRGLHNIADGATSKTGAAKPLPGPVKVEGDNRSPAGVFDLGEARGYADQVPDGATWPFLHSGTHARCMDNQRSNAYNTFVEIETRDPILLPAAELALRSTVFEYMVFVLHNTAPVVRGAGSCVFLHVWASEQQPTHGCIAMSRDDLASLITWFALEKRPVLVQLPVEQHQTFHKAWSLPDPPSLADAT